MNTSKSTTPLPYVDMANLGTRRRKRDRRPPERLHASYPKSQKASYGLLVHPHTINSAVLLEVSSFYTSLVAGYDDFLDSNYDRTRNTQSMLG